MIDWYEKDFPPNGTNCLVRHLGMWQKAEVIGKDSDGALVFAIGEKYGRSRHKEDFRPFNLWEKNFPKPGTLCEVFRGSAWELAYIVGTHNGNCVYQHKNEFYTLSNPEMFRPIDEEKEKSIKDAKQYCEYPGSWHNTYEPFIRALYDAGWRPPKEKSSDN